MIMAKKRAAGEPFSNRAFLQRTRDAVFLLNRKRRLRFANTAWEQLTGHSFEDVYDLYCTRHKSALPLAQTLAPPPEVMSGSVARVRRPVPKVRTAPPWWDIVFLPLAGPDGLYGVIGRITVVGGVATVKGRPMPAELLQLRQKLPERFRLDHLQSDVPQCQQVLEQIRLAAQHRAPVSLLGEPGTGKRQVARTIHHQGITAEQGFVAVYCEALPPWAQASVLFGDTALGKPESAGTIYLREPARMPRELQSRLAEWLHDRPPNGPRIVAGFRADPAEEIMAGRLLAELRLLLGIQTIALPPLRHRLDDLPRLATAIFERFKRAGGPGTARLDPAALEILRGYPWPGNLTEFECALESAALEAKGATIEPVHLPEAIRAVVGRLRAVSVTAAPPPPPRLKLDDLLSRIERRLIVRALAKSKGDKTAAAEALGIWRETLVRRIRTLKISDDEWGATAKQMRE
jgi:transcriptional regulator with PAS, ATPase and Fis domain